METSKNDRKNRILEHALLYAKLGLAVFPCKERKKEPQFKGWQDSCTTDPEEIKAIWSRNPQYNIAIATGSKSHGLVVVDIDNHDADGAESLREWEAKNGKLPLTATVITGSKGVHYYYRTDQDLRGRTNVLPGVDIRAEGNLIIAPPSVHPNGNEYEWDLGADIEDVGIAEADETVLKLVQGDEKKSKDKRFELPDIIRNGDRNDTLLKYACSLQSKGADDFSIRAAVIAANQEKCEVPVPDEEVDTIIKSALRYDKGSHGIDLIKTHTKNGMVIKQCAENVLRVLENDPKLKGQIFFDEFSYTAMWLAPLPWTTRAKSGEWTDKFDSELKSYLDVNYNLTKESAYYDGFNQLLNRHPIHPVAGWLQTLKWDGKPHIDHLAQDYIGAENTDYAKAVLKLFMLGAVNRVFEPGCKFDYVLVFVGEQGKGKTMFLNMLAHNDEWYDGNFSTLEGDKAAEKLRGKWILEMAELLAVKRQKDVEGFKAFVTATQDSYRAPYERRTQNRKRMCVFAATTNDESFMTDQTGNRRYLPIRINVNKPKKRMDHDPEEAAAEIEQAWAEAYHIYKTEHPALTMPTGMEREVLEVQARYMQEEPWIGMIQEYLNRHPELNRVCSKLLWDEVIGGDNLIAKNSDYKKITTIMQHQIEGWHQCDKKKRVGEYGLQLCFEPDVKLVPVSAGERVPF